MTSIAQKLRSTVIGRYKYSLILWTIIVIAAIPMIPLLMENLIMNPESPSYTESSKATEIIEKEFPESQNSNHILLIKMRNEGSVLNPTVQGFTMTFATEILSNEILNEYVTADNIAGFFTLNGTVIDQVYPELKYQFLSEDNRTTYIMIDCNDQGDFELSREMYEQIHEIIDGLEQNYDSELELILTGFTAMDVEGEEAVFSDMERIDLISIPLVIIALAIILRNPRLIFVPLLAILMTFLISFGIMGIVAGNIEVMNFVPNIMISLGLGIGVDYSLFLLSRFNEERHQNVEVPEAIDTMLTHAGHTILVSGLTLAVSFLGLIIFPISVFSSVGIAITVTVLVSLAINLTFVPAFLHLLGGWLTNYKTTPEEISNNEKANSYWKSAANFSSRHAIPILAIVVLIALPISVQLLNMNQSLDSFEMLPENVESREGFSILLEDFPPGLMSPMTVVIQTPSSGNVWSENFFNATQKLISELIATGDVDSTNIMCHTWMRGEPIPYSIASAAMDLVQITNETEKMMALASYPVEMHMILLLYPGYAQDFVGENAKIAIIPVTLSLDPFSQEASDWIDNVRSDIFPSIDELDEYDVYIGGLTAVLTDLSKVTYDYFPIMIFSVLLIIALLIGLMYKSIFVPFRLLATILLTISFIYGLSVLFFEEHWGEILKPSIGDLHGLFWMIPVMTFSILIGIGMDYDLFILGRIREGVWKGKKTKEAIADALHHTGGVVTGAALIMVLAFGGLMLSSSMMLVELGFILAIAVAIDATIVRTFLVPAIMSLAENTNWWPSKPPSKSSSSDE